MRFGLSPMINAIGVIFIVVTVIAAPVWASGRIRAERQNRAEASPVPPGRRLLPLPAFPPPVCPPGSSGVHSRGTPGGPAAGLVAAG